MIKKRPKLPHSVELVELPLSKEAQVRLNTAIVNLSDKTGRRILPSTILEVLFSEELVNSAVEKIIPKLNKLAELEKLKQELGIFFNE